MKHLKLIFTGALLILNSTFLIHNSVAQCLQIESILVDACVSGSGCSSTSGPCSCEGRNEMALFKVLGTAINSASLTPTWPNNSFKGWKQNAQTAANVATMNATIVKCGFLKEPVAGVLPANSEVLIITSWDICTGANSFANLQDTLFVLFQDTNNFQGHFVNQNNGGTISSVPSGLVLNRTLTLNYPPLACTQSVTYHPHLLVNNLGTYGGNAALNDGATVLFDAFGNDTYVNNGCQAPYIPITVDAGVDDTVCANGIVNINGTITGPYFTSTWSGGTGIFGNASVDSTTYTPGLGDVGVITLYLTAQGKCVLNVVIDSVQITITPLPSPAILSSNGDTVCIGDSTVLSVIPVTGTTYSWNPGGVSGTSFTVTLIAQTIYTVAATNVCATIIVTYTVDVNALPIISIVNDSVCPGTNGTLNASGASTYTWSGGSTGSSFSDSPASTTQFTVTGTDLNGCVNSSTGIIFIYQLPIVTVNSPSVCPSSTVTLTAGGATTYTWSTTQTGNTISVSPSGTTSYTVVGTDTNGCNNIAISSVTVFNPNVTASNSTVCSGTAATLTASGASTYTWSTGSNNASITVTVTSNTSYTVIGTDANGCIDSTVATVTVDNLPTITANASALSVCQGGSVTLTGGGGIIYVWTGGAPNGIPFVPTSTQTYTVLGIGFNGCSNFAAVTVVVNPLPTVTVNSFSICPGETTTLTAAGAITYTWSTTATGNSISVNLSVNTSYTVVGTDVNGCTNQAVSNVSMNALPTITVNSSSICPGATATLTAAGATTYTWSTTATGNSISVNPSANTSYTVVGTDANGCVNQAVSNVIINALPTISVNSPAACPAATTTLTASGGITYSWSTSQTGTSISVPGNATSYTVTGTDANGCSNTAVATVTLLALPTAQSVSGNSVICQGQSTTISVTPGPYTYSWTGPSGSMGGGTSVSVGQAGVYTLTVSNACGGAQSTFTVSVSSPNAAFSASVLSGQAPVNVVFTNASTGISLQNYWSLANGDTSTQLNTSGIYTSAGSYNATLIVTDSYGCKDTANVIIVVTDIPPVLIIPNIFSPNGDNINDMFMITATGITNFSCKIFDRWGLLMYEWADLQGAWDGKNATDGTYYYLIYYTDNKGVLMNKPGFLQLIK